MGAVTGDWVRRWRHGIGRRHGGGGSLVQRFLVEVPGHQEAELLEGGAGRPTQPPGVVADGGLEGVAGEPSVAEASAAWGAAEHLAEPLDRLGLQYVVRARR